MTISWKPPVTTSGSQAPSGYTVTAVDTTNPSNGGQTCTATTATTCTVKGLNSGDNYVFQVVATNSVGSSAATTTTTPVTPLPPTPSPSAVSSISTRQGNGEVWVGWGGQSSSGSSTAGTTYTVTGNNTTDPTAPPVTCTSTTNSCLVKGLVNGDGYTFTVTATNPSGSVESNPTNPINPAPVPNPPTVKRVELGNHFAVISWTPPATAKGVAAPAGYTILATDLTNPKNGGETCISTSDSCRINGLTNGDRYIFQATATNNVGASLPSTATNPMVPVAPMARAMGYLGNTVQLNKGQVAGLVTLTAKAASSSFTHVTVTGFAPNNRNVALSRARAVANFLRVQLKKDKAPNVTISVNVRLHSSNKTSVVFS